MPNAAVDIEAVTTVTDEIVTAFEKLLPQLSRSATILTVEQLAHIVAAPANTVLLARDRRNGRIVGTLTLVCMRIPTGQRAWIEDVVVDSSARGLGAGKALVDAALGHARTFGARTVDLTSNPSRAAAHALYEKSGFAVRDTRVYRYTP
ncbi:GNAT family N-acetyltransferase [Achromobacter aloeverae]|uniref:GNAT family N-acetyltransferase n=1 Tax=Achromobacter aloeverae TaxID=1750518 RepID=A0A4Q1HIR0_9BURK|nr:GNAT family N-acetyltransferase [Achromobacter aloeverae]RXN88114.1 GNAT family N-acetyltransferase [Achromobacter aloeverae]